MDIIQGKDENIQIINQKGQKDQTNNEISIQNILEKIEKLSIQHEKFKNETQLKLESANKTVHVQKREGIIKAKKVTKNEVYLAAKKSYNEQIKKDHIIMGKMKEKFQKTHTNTSIMNNNYIENITSYMFDNCLSEKNRNDLLKNAKSTLMEENK
jgi:hypothetical protein